MPAHETARGKAVRATLCLLNKERGARGLGALRPDAQSAQAAGRHNRLMVARTCFSHLCSGEDDLVGRMASSGYLPCDCTWLVGENIGWGAGGTASPRKIVAAWMRSSPHRINILNPTFDEIGIAIDRGSPESNSRDAATYTTDFGFKG